MRAIHLAAALALSLSLAGAPSSPASPRSDTWLFGAPASYIGLGIVDVSEKVARAIGLVEPHGIEISSIAENSPAEESGLQPGDVVLAYRGERVHGMEHFARLVKETPVGRKVELDIVRDGRHATVQVEIGQREFGSAVKERMDALRQRMDSVKKGFQAGPQRPCEDCPSESEFLFRFNFPQVHMHIRNQRLGAELEDIDGQLADYFGVESGVLVRRVYANALGGQKGLQAGDVIVALAGKPVRRASEVGRALSQADGASISVELMRDRKKLSLQLEARSRSAPWIIVRPVAGPP